ELAAGLMLGSILAIIGFARILLWQALFHTCAAPSLLVAFTFAFSLIGVVTWGTLAGSMLPLVLHKLGFDPASASAPFLATLVDVRRLALHFTAAETSLRGLF